MAKTYTQLLPSIDRRLSTWISMVEKSKTREKEPAGPTITISRQYGCEGFPLAEELKKIFEEKTGEEWNIYDKALLKKVSEEEELSIRLLEGLGDMTQLWDSLPIPTLERPASPPDVPPDRGAPDRDREAWPGDHHRPGRGGDHPRVPQLLSFPAGGKFRISGRFDGAPVGPAPS